jgi:hypothetical protein
MNQLTYKQERFAQHVVAVGNQTKVYREVYDVSPNTSDAVVAVKASELARNGKVAVRIRELQEDSARASLLTRQKVIADLIRNSDRAYELNRIAESNQALDKLAKIANLYEQPNDNDRGYEAVELLREAIREAGHGDSVTVRVEQPESRALPEGRS